MADINEKLFWALNGHPSTAGDYLMGAFSFTGYAIPAVLLAVLAMYFYGGISRRDFSVLALALLAGGVAVHGLKEFYGVERPLAYFAKKTPPQETLVHAPFERHRHGSFPSGHSQTAFSVAMFLSLRFHRHRFVWFLWAFLVAVSRVYLGVHFPSDVFAGAAIGVLVTFIVVKASIARA